MLMALAIAIILGLLICAIIMIGPIKALLSFLCIVVLAFFITVCKFIIDYIKLKKK